LTAAQSLLTKTLCTPNCTQKTANSSDRETRSQFRVKAVTKKVIIVIDC